MRGNLINRVMEGARQPVPEEGMGATVCLYSDRKAGTVFALPRSGKSLLVLVQEDKAKPTFSGMTDCQSYEYARDLNGQVWTFKQDRKGVWREMRMKHGRLVIASGGAKLVLGRRDKYHDFSF